MIKPIFAIGLAVFSLVGPCRAGELAKTVFVQKRLYGLYDDGTVSVWDPLTRKEDERQKQFVQSLGPFGLDARDDTLYILQSKSIAVVQRGAVTSRLPIKGTSFESQPLNFVELAGHSYAVFPDGIMDLGSGDRYALPELGGQLRKSFLRPLCYAVGQHKIWIGNGYGEWGGFLVGFDVVDKKWYWDYDSLHYVTGIALVGDKPQLVSWSMSHFMATAVLRRHDDDAKVVASYQEFEDRYFQTAAYSNFDRNFYVVEEQTLNVCDSDGNLTKLLDLPKRPYRREGMAIGVVPGVKSLVPIAKNEIIVVFAAGEPVLIEEKKVLQ